VAETIKTIQHEKLIENSRNVGGRLLGRLLQLKEKYEFVGDVRGRGLLIGLDLVSDAKNRNAMSRKVMEIVFRESLRRGLLSMSYFPRVRINPPLVITEAQADAGADILDEVFAHVRDEVDWRDAG
jgi:4-aminobutyrate aminotransferase-like enzyme